MGFGPLRRDEAMYCEELLKESHRDGREFKHSSWDMGEKIGKIIDSD